MFTPTAIRSLLQERPFRPFRIRLANGQSYDIRHPEFAWLTTSTVEVGLDPNEEGIVGRIARCSLVNVAELIDLAPDTPPVTG